MMNLSLGLIGFILLNSFHVSLSSHFESNLKGLLTADFSLQKIRPFTPTELQALQPIVESSTEEAKNVSFYSMISGNLNSRLIKINGITHQFPLYGSFRLKQQGQINASIIQNNLVEKKGVWMTQETLFALGLEKGDKVKIGALEFVIQDIVTDEPGSGFTNFDLAPKVYIAHQYAEETGLFRKGEPSKVYPFL